MKILLTGASGLVGSRVKPYLTAKSHTVCSLVRNKAVTGTEPHWQPDLGEINLKPAGNIDAVIHLAGETVAQRWTREVKRRIRVSRVEGTRLLCDALREQIP